MAPARADGAVSAITRFDGWFSRAPALQVTASDPLVTVTVAVTVCAPFAVGEVGVITTDPLYVPCAKSSRLATSGTVAPLGVAVPVVEPTESQEGPSALLVLAETVKLTGWVGSLLVMLREPSDIDCPVAPPPAQLAREPCATVRAGEFGRIAERFASLAFSLPEHYPGFARTVAIYTGADVFVRRGATQLAATGGAGPATLPNSGTVSYRGHRWLVFSFEPRPSTRVYVLAPSA